MNYFEFYNIPMSFQIDLKGLKRIYLLNNKKYHPDFHTLSSEDDQEEALRMATLNNDAYKTLKEFDLRIKYILELHDILESEGHMKLLKEFLIEMMDINESIMELQMEFNPGQQTSIIQSIDQFEKELEESIQDDLKTYQGQKHFNFSKIKNFYLKKKYLGRIKDNLAKIDSEV